MAIYRACSLEIPVGVPTGGRTRVGKTIAICCRLGVLFVDLCRFVAAYCTFGEADACHLLANSSTMMATG
jgi:hypothetical protein